MCSTFDQTGTRRVFMQASLRPPQKVVCLADLDRLAFTGQAHEYVIVGGNLRLWARVWCIDFSLLRASSTIRGGFRRGAPVIIIVGCES